MKKRPLTVGIERGELVIRVGVETLKQATDLCPLLYDGERDRCVGHVTDPVAWATAVCLALEHEEEDGTTLVDEMLDHAISDAVDGGEDGFELFEDRPSKRGNR